MFTLMALSMTLAASVPSLVGGPLQAPPPPAGTVVIETPCPAGARGVADCRHNARIEQRSLDPAHQRSSVRGETSWSERYSLSQYQTHSAANRRTVTLSDGFSAGGLTGGVEARQAPYWGYGHRVIVIGPSHAPQSAGQAAAARGLGQASH